jgi:serine/threonine-protein kinase RIO1
VKIYKTTLNQFKNRVRYIEGTRIQIFSLSPSHSPSFSKECLNFEWILTTLVCEGDHRFRHHLTNQNPRKVITLWAEKEMRNLKRLQSIGINAPKQIALN